MCVWLTGRVFVCVSVLVVLVVDVFMLVEHFVVNVIMVVLFGEVEVRADAHKSGC